MTMHALHDLLENGEVSSEEITRSVLERIEETEGMIQSFLNLAPEEEALARARQADRMIRDARRQGSAISPVAGIPIAIKDNMCTRGIPTTCGSAILSEFVPPYDATVVKRLVDGGAVMIGKTNMDEFAMGSSTENSRFHPTRNPWDPSRVPGGSSGGSAAAVAAGEAVAALGSDTGGSVRQPASFCSVVGLKPTYGRVSRYGLVAFASSLDQIGPLTRDVRDCAMVMNVIAGPDPMDSTCVSEPAPDYTGFLDRGVRGLRIGLPREYFGPGMDPEVRSLVEGAVRALEGLGAEVIDVTLPHSEYALATYYLVAPAEASSNLARYDGIRYGLRARGSQDVVSLMKRTRSEGFGPEVKRRIMLGTYALSSGYYDAYYLKALKVRTLLRQDLANAFERCDCVVSPTSPTVPFKLGERVEDPLAMYLSDIYTITANLTGAPAVSVPCGFSSGLPCGIHFVGRLFEEGTLIRIAHTLEGALGIADMRPSVAGRRDA
jgi:aspartyl-tRNA(Asn)/glutamyl-tRNA(Gln) amidotransferase subunit A